MVQSVKPGGGGEHQDLGFCRRGRWGLRTCGACYVSWIPGCSKLAPQGLAPEVAGEELLHALKINVCFLTAVELYAQPLHQSNKEMVGKICCNLYESYFLQWQLRV